MKKYIKYKNWYSKTRYILIKKYGKDYKLFSSLLAVTSPRFQIKRNYQTSLNIFDDYMKDKEKLLQYALKNKKRFMKKYKILPCHYNNLIRVFKHNFKSRKPLILSGLKVNSFYNNLTGHNEYVTLDIWMMKYFNFKKDWLNKSDYIYYTRIIRKLAQKENMNPCQLQAVLWHKQRGKENIQPKNFYMYTNIN